MGLRAISDGFLDLSVVNSVIRSSGGTGVLGQAGDSIGGGSLSLFIMNSTIDVSGTALAGIEIDSPSTGFAILGVNNTTVKIDGTNRVGIQLLGTGISCGCAPSIAAQIYDSTISATGGSIGLSASASNSSLVVFDVQHSNISGDAFGMVIDTSGDAFLGAGISDASEITSDGVAISVLSDGTDGVQIGVFDSLIASGAEGIYLFESSTSQLDAWIAGNTFITASALSSSLTFEKNGLSTQAIFENNTFFSLASAIVLQQKSTNPFTVTITNNTVLESAIAGIWLDNQAGTLEAEVNGNSVTTSIGGVNYLFEGTGGPINLNSSPPLPFLEDNTADGPSLHFLQSTGTVNGDIIINGTTLSPIPLTFP
jgi:hypothetical protein